MTVTKEMIEAGVKAQQGSDVYLLYRDDAEAVRAMEENIEAILTAALSSRSAEAGKPVVKGLEWVKHPVAEAWRADTMLGTYQVWAGSLATGWQFDGFIGERINEKSNGEVSAKAAAQADYEARILSTLSTPADSEPVAWISEHKFEKGRFWLSEANGRGDNYWTDAFPVYRQAAAPEDWK